MRLRDLFTPSFRNRLRLFFVVIVIIPMIAVGFVLFRLVRESDNSQADAQVNLAQKGAENLDDTASVGVVILRNGRVLAASRPALGRAELPASGGAAPDGNRFRLGTLQVRGFDGRPLTIRIALPANAQNPRKGASWIVVGALLGFLLLAVAFAVTVSRTLQAEVQRLLTAAREIGRGNFAVEVPTAGNDEFAALGQGVTSMASQLRARLEELQRERARLQDAIRRV